MKNSQKNSDIKNNLEFIWDPNVPKSSDNTKNEKNEIRYLEDYFSFLEEFEYVHTPIKRKTPIDKVFEL